MDQFEDGVKEVQALLALAPPDSSDLPVTAAAAGHSHAGAIVRRAAVVLLVSHFEGYLKRLAEGMVDAVNTGDVEARRLPQGLKNIHILPKLEEIVACGDEVQRASLLVKLDKISSLWKPQSKPPRGTLRVSTVTRIITNADSDCISLLFETFGAEDDVCAGDVDVVDGEGVVESHNIRGRLRDLVKCRNDIAHGDADRIPTREDVTRYIAFLTYFAKRLDRKAAALGQRFSLES
jgi:hypothetical protein